MFINEELMSVFKRVAFGLFPGLYLVLGAVSATAQERTVRIPILADARNAVRTEWRYTNSSPGDPAWTASGFDDSQWNSALGGFGTGTVAGAIIATDWSTTDIWLRRAFNIAEMNPEALILGHHHDEDAEYFINGVMVYQESGWLGAYADVYLADEYKALLKPEGNVFAIHCRNADGPGYVDAGLAYTVTLQATSLVADARTFPEQWKYEISDPGQDWYLTGFDAATWFTGRAGFGSSDIYAATVGSEWLSGDLWMRKTITLDKEFPRYLVSYQHDDAMEVYINGALAFGDAGYTPGYQDQVLSAASLGLKAGANLIAIHCHNNDGAQYVDLGLQGLEKSLPTGARKAGSRKAFPVPVRSQCRVLASQGVLRMDDLAPATGGRLELSGLDGRVRSAVSVGQGVTSLALPRTLGTGMFRYRWDSPLGIRQGTLVNLP
jgi:hypothetical protein